MFGCSGGRDATDDVVAPNMEAEVTERRGCSSCLGSATDVTLAAPCPPCDEVERPEVSMTFGGCFDGRGPRDRGGDSTTHDWS